MLDHALRTVASQPSELQRETERLEKGHAKAALAIAMGSALSESPAESVCPTILSKALAIVSPTRLYNINKIH